MAQGLLAHFSHLVGICPVSRPSVVDQLPAVVPKVVDHVLERLPAVDDVFVHTEQVTGPVYVFEIHLNQRVEY